MPPPINRVDEFAPPFMGLDCGYKAEDTNKAAGALTSTWFGDCISTQNFNVLGPILTMAWTRSLKVLTEQGWGIVIFYVGLNPGIAPSPTTWNVNSPSAATTKQALTTGTRHGKHIKVAVSKLLDDKKIDNSGCVVYLDNEGGVLKPAWRTYYNAVFEEMRKPGPDSCQSVRPVLYARDQSGGVPNASEMLDSNPDLFVWVLDHHHEAQKGSAHQ